MLKKSLHTARQLLISLLLTGFLAHMMMPLSGYAKKTAFTQWLHQNLIASGDDNEIRLRNTINELPAQSDSFNALLLKASRLVKDYSDEFNIRFSFQDHDDEPMISSWLAGQWNASQHQQNSKVALLTDGMPLLTKCTFQLSDFSSASRRTELQPAPILFEYSISSMGHPSFISKPLSGGVSINAP